MSKKSLLVLVGLGLLAACAEPPTGPANVDPGASQQQPRHEPCDYRTGPGPRTDLPAARVPETCPI